MIELKPAVRFFTHPILKVQAAIIKGEKVSWHGQYVLDAYGKWFRYRKKRAAVVDRDVIDYLNREFELHIARSILEP